jgi:hypothetical protein
MRRKRKQKPPPYITRRGGSDEQPNVFYNRFIRERTQRLSLPPTRSENEQFLRKKPE